MSRRASIVRIDSRRKSQDGSGSRTPRLRAGDNNKGNDEIAIDHALYQMA